MTTTNINTTHTGAVFSTSSEWTVTSAKEKINLVRSVRTNNLKNRILATHLLEFFDARKPRFIGINEWNNILLDRLEGIMKIPGMRQFDIDGLTISNSNSNGNREIDTTTTSLFNSDNQQQSSLEKVNNVLFYCTSLILFVGVAFSIGMFNRIFFNDGHSF